MAFSSFGDWLGLLATTALAQELAGSDYKKANFAITKNTGGLSKSDRPPRFVLQLIHFPYTSLNVCSWELPKTSFLRYFYVRSDG